MFYIDAMTKLSVCLFYVAARSAVVSAVAHCKREYYRNQIASCDGNQGRLLRVMKRQSDPILFHSLSDIDLASSFS